MVTLLRVTALTATRNRTRVPGRNLSNTDTSFTTAPDVSLDGAAADCTSTTLPAGVSSTRNKIPASARRTPSSPGRVRSNNDMTAW